MRRPPPTARTAGCRRNRTWRSCFSWDDADRQLIAKRRGAHNRLGFALLLTTVRYLGVFLPDPLAVPDGVTGYLAGQLEISDPSCVQRYTERRTTRFEHADEIKAAYGLREFEAVEKDLREWVDARAWTTSDGPKAIFGDAVRWLRERDVLLPGVTVLARLVAQVREEAYQRLWDTLHGMLTGEQRRLLDCLAVVPEGERFSPLERWRRGPAKASGLNMVKALDRVSQITGTGFGRLDLESAVPARRLTELARYGMTASATQIRRHPPPRRLATLLSTVVHLESKATDDALELLDLLMATELLGKAERDSDKDKVRRHPRLARALAKLAAAVEVLFEVTEYGTEITLEQLWEGIEAVISRRELRDAVEAVTGMVPPPDADDDGQMRALLAARIATVSGFVKILTEVIAFGATADGMQVLAAMKDLPRLLDGRRAKNLTAGDIDADLVRGSWTRLVFPGEGRVERNAYVFCVLTQFHARLKRRDIYAETSTRWRDPRAQLLDGEAWTAAKDTVLTALGLPEDPDALLAAHARLLDGHLPGRGRTVHGQRRGQRGCGRAAARRADQGDPGTGEPDRPAQAGRRDAAAGRPARGAAGGDGLGPGVRRGVHVRLRQPLPAGGPGHHHRGLPDRARAEHRLRAGSQKGRAGH
jgi:hypothetical protein